VPPRVGSALDYLCATIVALAVFALPISIVLLAKGYDPAWFVLGFVLGVLLSAAALARLVAVRGGRPSAKETVALFAGVGALTWVTAFIALSAVLSIVWSSTRCIGNLAGWIGTIGALVIYSSGGGWSLARGRSTAFFVMPGAVVVGAIWLLLTWRFLPAGAGICND
jgi:hypothetical protein